MSKHLLCSMLQFHWPVDSLTNGSIFGLLSTTACSVQMYILYYNNLNAADRDNLEDCRVSNEVTLMPIKNNVVITPLEVFEAVKMVPINYPRFGNMKNGSENDGFSLSFI